MIVVGLTGGIASGKSTATRQLAKRGARTIDADLLGHQAYAPGNPAHAAVVAAFGDGVVAEDGSIDRAALGAIVFADPARRTELTDIVWPEIRRLAEVEIEQIRREDAGAVVILEAAVLLEAGWEDLVDEVWVVRVEPDVAAERLMARNGFDREAAESRIRAQLDNAERTRRADRVVDNSADEADLLARLDGEWDALVARAPSA